VAAHNGHGEIVRLLLENKTFTEVNQIKQYLVTVPPYVRPGQTFRVMVCGETVAVTCPEGVTAEQRRIGVNWSRCKVSILCLVLMSVSLWRRFYIYIHAINTVVVFIAIISCNG
jgi:hypothetical protein